jgi:hypothetical protein
MNRLIVSDIKEDVDSDIDVACIDICKERILKRAQKSDRIGGNMMRSPPLDINDRIKFNTSGYLCYRIWERIQEKCKGKDEYTDKIEELEENRVEYIPLGYKESNIAAMRFSDAEIRDELLTMIKEYKKVTSLRKAEEFFEYNDELRHILEGLKTVFTEEDVVQLFTTYDKNKIEDKLEFEAPSITIQA